MGALDGPVAIVTGAGTGIGREAAKPLAAEGARRLQPAQAVLPNMIARQAHPDLEEEGMAGMTFTVIDGERPVEVDEAEGVARAARAEASGRPVSIDRDERAAFLGVSAAARATMLSSLEAPDFTLPDLDGRLHSLSEQRGKKVLLVAYASW